MEFIPLAIASIVLTLRSMYSLMPERSQVAKKQEPTLQTTAERNEPVQLHLLLNKADIVSVLYATCMFLKQNPYYTVTIEKIMTNPMDPEYLLIAHPIFIQYLTQYTQIAPISEVWTDQWQRQYIVINTQESAVQPIALQYTLSHKYGQIYYITHQMIVAKPAGYEIDGIDLFKWSQFLSRQHATENSVITEDKLISSIKES